MRTRQQTAQPSARYVHFVSFQAQHTASHGCSIRETGEPELTDEEGYPGVVPFGDSTISPKVADEHFHWIHSKHRSNALGYPKVDYETSSGS